VSRFAKTRQRREHDDDLEADGSAD